MTWENVSQFLINLFSFDETHPLLFTQFNFWAFFAIVYALFALFHSKRLLRNTFLFFVSLLFYYKTSGLFVLILLFDTFLDYFLGVFMDKSQRNSWRKTFMISGVVINLLILFYFKYAYFCTDAYNTIVGSEHEVINWLAQWTNNWTGTNYFDASKILLPVGISFYTFQNISYLVDVYKRKIAHVSNILDFGFYVSFFPQLVAGPIVRADQFVPQLYKKFFLTRRQFGIAVFWILNGLAKKLIMSDYLAVNFVDRVFNNPSLFTAFENLSALFVYSLQVYADFSGYTDIAIGVAMLMGFYLPVNFNSPYKAQNPTDFWRRWHMSLSRWLRDYLYIPLGGNRSAGFASYFILAAILLIAAFRLQNLWFTLAACAVIAVVLLLLAFRPSHRRTLGTNVNNMDTMLLGGLWHGSSFNFITWGGLNGLGILVYKWWKDRSWATRLLTLLLLASALTAASYLAESPLVNLLAFCLQVLLGGYLVLFLLSRIRHATSFNGHLSTVWSVLITFVFISFTRLFFRSGSNLDPAEANETAWRTASQMVQQIGSHWNLAQVPDILSNYAPVFILFALGMAVHWLPERFKRRYRLWFASTPLWLMGLGVVLLAVVLYQFVTADLQPFIYFQF